MALKDGEYFILKLKVSPPLALVKHNVPYCDSH
jgi:hypothetical protein